VVVSLLVSVGQEQVLVTVFRVLLFFILDLSLSQWWVVVTCFVRRRSSQPAQQLAKFSSAFIQAPSACASRAAGNPSGMRAALLDNAVLLSLPGRHPSRGKGSFGGGRGRGDADDVVLSVLNPHSPESELQP